MDNNVTPPENSEGKKNSGKPNNFRRRRAQRPPQKDQAENSPNGSITVKPGRYDLPPEAERKNDGEKRDNRPRQQKPRQKPEEQSERNERPEQKNSNRRRRGRRRQNQNQPSGNVPTEEIVEIAAEEKAISE